MNITTLLYSYSDNLNTVTNQEPWGMGRSTLTGEGGKVSCTPTGYDPTFVWYLANTIN